MYLHFAAYALDNRHIHRQILLQRDHQMFLLIGIVRAIDIGGCVIIEEQFVSETVNCLKLP